MAEDAENHINSAWEGGRGGGALTWPASLILPAAGTQGEGMGGGVERGDPPLRKMQLDYI